MRSLCIHFIWCLLNLIPIRLVGGIGFTSRCSKGACELSSAATYPGTANCTVNWFEQSLDHFNFATKQTFQQRYFVYDKFWSKGGPIFFYTGNEASVALYVNATGLMWENAEQFGALLLFAEHRYYGESLPFGDASSEPKNLQWLTMEQALADFASLLYHWTDSHDSSQSKVVAFGGSYGGMLAAWLRMKYPALVNGAISASAPVLAFDSKASGPFTGESYWEVVTKTATSMGGVACSDRVRDAWLQIFSLGRNAAGRETLTSLFHLCAPLQSAQDAEDLALHLQYAWDVLAMGNFPYPSNYLVFQETGDPTVTLPAFPVRAACEHMTAGGSSVDAYTNLINLREATGVLYNVTGAKQCFALPPHDDNEDGIWDYQWCTEALPQETYFRRDGVKDMFWSRPQNLTAIKMHCLDLWGVAPKRDWIDTEFGGVAGASNIVFTNGGYDPWSSGGVLHSSEDGKVVAIVIPEGAHHLDLMFSNPLDPPSVVEARNTEMEHVARWLAADRANLTEFTDLAPRRSVAKKPQAAPNHHSAPLSTVQ